MDDHNADKVYWQCIAKLSYQEKYQRLLDLYWSARELKAAGLRMLHPEWPEENIQEKVREVFLYARS